MSAATSPILERLPSPDHTTVGACPQRRCRAVHAAFASVLALSVGLLTGGRWAPVRDASAQSGDLREALPAALAAHSENGDSSFLPLLRESLRVRIVDGHATATYDPRIFQNETQARLRGKLSTPRRRGAATATGFAYYNAQERIVGEIFERESARQVYEAMTGLRRDPGLLEQAGEGGFSFRVFPIEPGEQKRIQVTTSLPWLPRRGGPVEYAVRGSVAHRCDRRCSRSQGRPRRPLRSLSPSHDLSASRRRLTRELGLATVGKGQGGRR